MKRFFISDGKIKESTLLANYIIAMIILCGIFFAALNIIGIKLDFPSLVEYKGRIWDGFIMTIQISILSLICSLLIGILAAFGRNSRIIIIRAFSDIYVTVIRGTPLISQIYLFYYIIGTALGIENRILVGVVILAIFEGAYIAEIIRGSLLSIDKTQLEVAKSVGFSTNQTFLYVILPQLIARTMPPLTGQFASIIKDSSLLSIIAIIELTQTMREITATNYKFFEAYLLLGLLYLILTLPLTYASQRLEKRFNYAN